MRLLPPIFRGMPATIYYDGDCPFCTKYVGLVRLRDAVGPVALVDVRTDAEARRRMQDAGLDLDQGMVLEHEGQRFWGADAVHHIALLSTASGAFNAFSAAVLGQRTLSRLLYPLLRSGRNAALFLLGRQRLAKNGDAELSAFAIFAHAFGVYAFADMLYAIHAPVIPLISLLFGGLGLYLLARPRSPRVFALLVGCMLVGAIGKMPLQSNHAMLVTFSLGAMVAAALYVWLRGGSWVRFMAAFAPIGRCLLLTMYFFGVFHKINTGFLNPEVSCAVELWKAMPGPLPLFDPAWWRLTMIYGTLVGEAAILLGLLFHRTRHAAVMLGIAFHSMLALSGYGFYLAFSTLTIALHLLFIAPGAAQRITSARSWRLLQANAHTLAGLVVLILWAAALVVLADRGQFTTIALLWLPWPLWLIGLVARHGRERIGETTVGPPIWSRTWALNLLSIAFFANCFMPFLGLKNAQAMNMFANITYEAGRSNHLLLPGPGPFGYLGDVVELKAVDGRPFAFSAREGRYMTYYALLDRLDREPQKTLSFVRNGALLENQTPVTLAANMRELHPRWFRKWFHFRNFNAHDVQTCERGFEEIGSTESAAR